MADWISVEIALPADVDETRLDILSGALFEVGSAGLELKDGPSGPEVVIAAFSPDMAPHEIPIRVDAALDAAEIKARGVVIRSEEPVDWSTHWRRHFVPMHFGELWVVPTWIEPPLDARYLLRIDPGMAFGTGSHATTALCLERLMELAPIRSVLDVGTGTGILALAAIASGSLRVVGTDNDPDALVVARENAEMNGLSERLVLRAEDPDALKEQFDVVVANILSEPLIQMAPKIGGAVTPGGRLILSGLLTTQADGVAAAYEARGFTGRVIETRGEWARVELIAPAAAR